MLEDFIEVNKLSAKVFPVRDEVHTAAKAAAAMEGDADAVAKSIVLVASGGQGIVVVLLGKDKVDLQKVKSVMGVNDVALASPKEVFGITGYEIGGVPPVSIYGVATIVDRQLLEKGEVICGGGDPHHLMRIRVSDIVEFAENVAIDDVRK
ncbi:MAG TPA: YbaK/EbsC family protein [Candidatus Diapherotrites archaeon]|uniref:YbaK/EbsC family protein n=1 Tax=Candidatus Iainarchaeum sp. TaxID=3101447 RepID=A0A7J4IZY4_9ARCH|nr:YbaK/EbsC family protein [Candidatus Diapherotrites archaeon]